MATMESIFRTALWDENYKIYKAIDLEYHRLAVHCGLPDCEYYMMCTLYEHDGSATQQDMVSEWAYSKQTVHSSARSLERKGLVTIHIDEKNRRRKILTLTDSGRVLAEETIPQLFKAENHSFGQMPEQILRDFNEALSHSLDRFREAVNEITDDKKGM